jgi:hypothetical protein
MCSTSRAAASAVRAFPSPRLAESRVRMALSRHRTHVRQEHRVGYALVVDGSAPVIFHPRGPRPSLTACGKIPTHSRAGSTCPTGDLCLPPVGPKTVPRRVGKRAIAAGPGSSPRVGAPRCLPGALPMPLLRAPSNGDRQNGRTVKLNRNVPRDPSRHRTPVERAGLRRQRALSPPGAVRHPRQRAARLEHDETIDETIRANDAAPR